MAYASRDEQETWLNYDPLRGDWQVYSTHPPDIRRIKTIATVTNEVKDEQGRTILIDGYVARNQIRLFKPL